MIPSLFLFLLSLIIIIEVACPIGFDPKSVELKEKAGPDTPLDEKFQCGDFAYKVENINNHCNQQLGSTPLLRMAAIVQVYNHASLAHDVIKSLQSQENIAHVQVFEDGSTDGSFDAYQTSLRHFPGSHLFQTPNNHEIRNYNTGIRNVLNAFNSSIDLFALMQDDDILRKPDDWGKRASDLFQRFPHLCVLGGYVGWNSVMGGTVKLPEYYGQEPSYLNPNARDAETRRRIRRPCGGQVFEFVGAIASSPMILRKSCIQDIGLLSEMTTRPGDAGILFDVEYSLRAWTSGRWSVGLYKTQFRHGIGGHSSLKNAKKQSDRRQAARKARKFIATHYRNMACSYYETT